MSDVKWFKAQLKNSLDMFVWAVDKMPAERLNLDSPNGDWSTQRQVHHLYTYEKLILPYKRQWLPNGLPVSDEEKMMMKHMWSEQKSHWYKKDTDHWLKEFITLREETIKLVSKFDDDAWNIDKENTLWGTVNLFWIYSKTVQHTLEHTDSVMKMVLFWDDLEK